VHDELRPSWQILTRGAVLALAAWSLADGAGRGGAVDDEALPVRRAAPGPQPLPWPTEPVVLPRATAATPEPEARRSAGPPGAAATRPSWEASAPRPSGMPGRRIGHARQARLLLFVAPKNGPPSAA
jgi:hypothetical protein